VSDHRAQRHPDGGRRAFGNAEIDNALPRPHVDVGELVEAPLDEISIEAARLRIEAAVEKVCEARAHEPDAVPAIAMQGETGRGHPVETK
jgi:hypothetical protein